MPPSFANGDKPPVNLVWVSSDDTNEGSPRCWQTAWTLIAFCLTRVRNETLIDSQVKYSRSINTSEEYDTKNLQLSDPETWFAFSVKIPYNWVRFRLLIWQYLKYFIKLTYQNLTGHSTDSQSVMRPCAKRISTFTLYANSLCYNSYHNLTDDATKVATCVKVMRPEQGSKIW